MEEDIEESQTADMEVYKMAKPERAIFAGISRAKTGTTRKIYRHEINDCPSWIEKHLFEYSLDRKIALVWLVFKCKASLEEACHVVESGVLDSDKLKANWNQMDKFALDYSKTFINGKRYL